MGLCQGMAITTERMIFGTSIANIYTRNVLDYAQSAASMHELSGGRFRFGVGVSHAPINDHLGVTTGRPLDDVRTFVETVRGAPRLGEQPPIVLAAMRDRMMALAAEIGDGVVMANAARSAVAGSLERMPAVSDDFFVGCMIPTCVSDDRAAAAAVHRRTLTTYVGFPNYVNYWKAAGYQEEMEAIEAARDAGDRDGVMALMTDDWLADVTLHGSAGEVRDGLEAWYDAGVSTPILVPSSVSGGQFQAFEELFAIFE